MQFRSAEEAMLHFKEMQRQITELNSKRNDLIEQYKKQTKEYFGVSDGEALNLVQMAEVIMKVVKQ
jgi:hypothetical protein